MWRGSLVEISSFQTSAPGWKEELLIFSLFGVSAAARRLAAGCVVFTGPVTEFPLLQCDSQFFPQRERVLRQQRVCDQADCCGLHVAVFDVVLDQLMIWGPTVSEVLFHFVPEAVSFSVFSGVNKLIVSWGEIRRAACFLTGVCFQSCEWKSHHRHEGKLSELRKQALSFWTRLVWTHPEACVSYLRHLFSHLVSPSLSAPAHHPLLSCILITLCQPKPKSWSCSSSSALPGFCLCVCGCVTVCMCVQMAHLVQVKSHGLSGSQSLYDPHGVSSSSASPSPSRPPMPRQNSDPTSDTPPPPPLSRLAPPLDKLDRSSWLRQDDDMPPKVSACPDPCVCVRTLLFFNSVVMSVSVQFLLFSLFVFCCFWNSRCVCFWHWSQTTNWQNERHFEFWHSVNRPQTSNRLI